MTNPPEEIRRPARAYLSVMGAHSRAALFAAGLSLGGAVALLLQRVMVYFMNRHITPEGVQAFAQLNAVWGAVSVLLFSALPGIFLWYGAMGTDGVRDSRAVARNRLALRLGAAGYLLPALNLVLGYVAGGGAAQLRIALVLTPLSALLMMTFFLVLFSNKHNLKSMRIAALFCAPLAPASAVASIVSYRASLLLIGGQYMEGIVAQMAYANIAYLMLSLAQGALCGLCFMLMYTTRDGTGASAQDTPYAEN